MRRILKKVVLIVLVFLFAWIGTVIADKKHLREDLIRIHVVANSNSSEDRRCKLAVRDALKEYLYENLDAVRTSQQAKDWMSSHLQQMEATANTALRNAGSEACALAVYREEFFPMEHNHSFSLPAGAYSTLRITIGKGEGENWWCIAFPILWESTTAEDFRSLAADVGFPDDLTGALVGEREDQPRFVLLNCLGLVENFLFP